MQKKQLLEQASPVSSLYDLGMQQWLLSDCKRVPRLGPIGLQRVVLQSCKVQFRYFLWHAAYALLAAIGLTQQRQTLN